MCTVFLYLVVLAMVCCKLYEYGCVWQWTLYLQVISILIGIKKTIQGPKGLGSTFQTKLLQIGETSSSSSSSWECWYHALRLKFHPICYFHVFIVGILARGDPGGDPNPQKHMVSWNELRSLTWRYMQFPRTSGITNTHAHTHIYMLYTYVWYIQHIYIYVYVIQLLGSSSCYCFRPPLWSLLKHARGNVESKRPHQKRRSICGEFRWIIISIHVYKEEH